MIITPEPPWTGGLMVFFTDREIGVRRTAVARVSSVPEERIFMPLQRHTDRVFVLDGPCRPPEADAVVTGRRGLLLGVQVADCVPILLADPVRGVVGAVHAGWRGTAGGILRKTLQVMADGFSAGFDDILIALGPSIRGCCYSVGEDTLRAVAAATGEGDYVSFRDGRAWIDLAEANRAQAVSMGVPEENLWISGICTCCNPGRFHSYRCSQTKERQGGFIGLK